MRRTILLILTGALCGACTPAPAQQLLGPYTGHLVEGNTVSLFAHPSTVRLTFRSADIVRVDFLPGTSSRPDSSFVVTGQLVPPPALAVSDAESSLTIASAGLTIVASKYPLRLQFRDGTGDLLTEPPDGGPVVFGDERHVTFTLGADEHLYGGGERGPGLDLQGSRFECYNTPVYGYGAAPAMMNINVPVLLSTRGYGVYFDSPHRSWFDIGGSRADRLSFRTSGGELTYYLFRSVSLAGLLDLYANLTGRAPMPPRWALGYIQSKYGYRNEAEARATVDSLRSRRIPADALVLDLYWFRHMGDLEWNHADWPSPFLMMSAFRERGIRTILITEPYLVERSPNHGIAAANGWLARTSAGQPYPLPQWWSCGCTAGLLDMTDPGARSWFWDLHPPFLGSHVAGLWTDLGEPERHPEDMQHTLGPAPAVHNIYNLLWAETIHEGLRRLRPGERVFNLTRSGFAGIQRYGVSTWSGDVARSFGGLAAQPGFILSMGMSGIAYHASDIGGFCCGTTTPELYVRWMQLGAFSPIMRAHGTGQGTEPWAFGPQAEAIARRFIELRYELLPYTYTLAAEHHRKGLPLARPLALAQLGDPAFARETGAFLWGDALLVAPVTGEGSTALPVAVPEGRWFDYWTDGIVEGGGTVTLPAPLDRLPLLVRAGSIIPLSPVVQHTGEMPGDTIRLAMYPRPGREARFTLYEDDGLTTAYEQGAYAVTTFRQWFSATDTVADAMAVIGPTSGVYDGRPPRRVYRVELHAVQSPPAAVRVNGRSVPVRATPGDLRTQGDGWYFDPAARVLSVQTVTVPDSSYLIIAEGVRLTALGERPATGEVPDALLLEPAFPNPFNPGTAITFRLRRAGRVQILIYDLLGRLVDSVMDGNREEGSHTVQWRVRDLPTGVYLAVVRFEEGRGGRRTEVRSMKLLALR